MNEEINTVSEEQVLHNKLSFEINQELIHLMKRIVELQQENARLKDKIGKLKFAIESNCIKDGKKYQEICCDGDYLLEILKEN